MLVNTTIVKDEKGICAAGYAASVSANATIVGVELILLDTTPPAYCGETIYDNSNEELLHLIDPTRGNIWVRETEESWANKINGINAASGGQKSLQFTIGVDGPPAGSTSYTNSSLIGKEVRLFVNGGDFLVEGTNFDFDDTTGTITLLNGALFNNLEVWTIFY